MHPPKQYPGVRRNTSKPLNGSLNDCACLRHLLMTRFGYLDGNITVLRDDLDPEHWPTRENMLRQMQALLAGQAPGDSLFFSFSGEPTCRLAAFSNQMHAPH